MKRYMLITLLSLAMMSCDHRDARTINTKDMHIQVQRAERNDPGMVSAQIRVSPDAAVFSEMDSETKQSMLYRSDSCFYMEDRGRKIYPVAIIPIANGVNGSFEYLITFDRPGELKETLRLMYYAKYLNKKQYELYPKF